LFNRDIVRRTRRRRKERISDAHQRTCGLFRTRTITQFPRFWTISRRVALLDRKAPRTVCQQSLQAMANDGALPCAADALRSWPSSARQIRSHDPLRPVGAPAHMAIPHPDDGRSSTILVTPAHGREYDGLTGLGIATARRSSSCSDPARPSTLPPFGHGRLPADDAEAQWLTGLARPFRVDIGSDSRLPNTVKRISVASSPRRVLVRRSSGSDCALRSVRGDCEA